MSLAAQVLDFCKHLQGLGLPDLELGWVFGQGAGFGRKVQLAFRLWVAEVCEFGVAAATPKA